MVTPDLIAFIRGEMAKGESKDSIVNLLKTNNWTDSDINEAFIIIAPVSAPVSAPAQVGFSIAPSMSRPVEPEVVFRTKSHKKVWVLGFVVLFLVVVGGALAYASGYFTPLDKVFAKALQSSQSNSKGTFTLNVKIDGSNFKAVEIPQDVLAGMSKTFDMNMNGSYDASDEKNIKSVVSFSGSSGTSALGFDFRTTDGSLYVSLTKAPDIGSMSLKQFENKWIVFPYKNIDGSLAPEPILSKAGIQSNPFGNLTDSEKQHIAEITSKASFVKVTGKHLPENVGGALSFHFDFDIDKKGIGDYLSELTSYLKSIDNGTIGIPEFNREDYDKATRSIKLFKGEVWIGMFDKLPHKIVVNSEIINPDKPEDGVLKISATSMSGVLDKPLIVEVPQNATTIEVLMSSMFGGMIGGPSTDSTSADSILAEPVAPSTEVSVNENGNDSQIKSIHSNMIAQAELFNDSNKNSYSGFCRSKGDYGAYALAKQLPSNTVYKCNDSNQAWSSWSKLSTDEYFCVDSGRISETIVGVPSGTSCPGR